jgi:hypothetical protein
MEILKFDEFRLNEGFDSNNEDFDYEFEDLDEGLMDALKKVMAGKGDPKTADDFMKSIKLLLDAASKKGVKDPVQIAEKIRNFATMYLNKQGFFAKRSGNAVPKPLGMVQKGVEVAAKAGAAKAAPPKK